MAAATPEAVAAAAVKALSSGDAVQAAQAALYICMLTSRDEPPSILIEGVRCRQNPEPPRVAVMPLRARLALTTVPRPQVPALVSLLRSPSPALQVRWPRARRWCPKSTARP